MAKREDETATYDFSEITDEAKSALALSHEAIKPVMDSLPEVVGEFFKSAATELKFEATPVVVEKGVHKKGVHENGNGENEDEDEEDEDKKKERMKKAEEKENLRKTEMIKSALPGALEAAQEQATAPLRIEIKKAQDEVTLLTDRLQRDDMRVVARSLVTEGDKPSEAKVDELITIRKSMPDEKAWNTYLEGQRGLVAQIEKSALFERESHPSSGTPGSAFDQLQSLANGIIEKSENKDPGDAWDFAVKANPTLYDQHRREQAAQAKAGVAA